ncbi:DAW1 factor, partial [Polypterus senegalus]
MAASAKRKQEEKHLKMLREMTSLLPNRKCFDCDQRGPTYANMTVGSFVCTSCSGILYVPPEQAKVVASVHASISGSSASSTSSTPEVRPLKSLLGDSAPALHLNKSTPSQINKIPKVILIMIIPQSPVVSRVQVQHQQQMAQQFQQEKKQFDLLSDLGGDIFAAPAPQPATSANFANFAHFNSHTGSSSGLANTNFANFDNFPKCSSADFGASQSNATGAPKAAVGKASIPTADKYAALADLDNIFSSAKPEQGAGGQASNVNSAPALAPPSHPASIGGDRYAALAELDSVFSSTAPTSNVYSTTSSVSSSVFGTGATQAQSQQAIPSIPAGFGGIILEYEKGGELKTKSIDLLDLSQETDISALVEEIKKTEPLITPPRTEQVKQLIQRLQEKLGQQDDHRFFLFKVLRAHILPLTNVAFNKSGSSFITGSYDRTCKIWDTASGEELHMLEGHRNVVYAIAFNNPYGDKIATGSFDKTCKLWSAETGKCFHTFRGHSAEIVCLSFNPQSTLVATGSMDNTAKLWDIQTGEEAVTLTGHSAEIISLSFNTTGDKIITGSFDHTVSLWDVQSGRQDTHGKHAGRGVDSLSRRQVRYLWRTQEGATPTNSKTIGYDDNSQSHGH